MSIKIAPLGVNLPALPTSDGNIDSSIATDPSAIAPTGFAALLLALQASINTKPALPFDTAQSAEDETSVAATDVSTTPQDPASLLVAISVTPPEKVAVQTATDAVQTTAQNVQNVVSHIPIMESTAQTPLAQKASTQDTKKTATSLSAFPLQATTANTDPAEKFTNQAILPTTQTSNDKPAKLAASDTPLPLPGTLQQPADETIDAAGSTTNVPLNVADIANNADVAKKITPKDIPIQASTTLSESERQNTLNGVTAMHVPSASHLTPGNTPIAQSNTSLAVETSVRHSDWGNDFSQKVVWLANNDKQVAQLTLNPPHMGPIEIALNMNKDSANAFFVSPHAEVREAIETALPRLREMLAGVGIELGQTNVSAESFRQQAEHGRTPQGTFRWNDDKANAILGGVSVAALSDPTNTVSRGGNSLIDLFA